MRIFKNTKESNKSWAIALQQIDESLVELIAVDDKSGKRIVGLLGFTERGQIVRFCYVETELMENGYNPYEHNNSFDNLGAIEIF